LEWEILLKKRHQAEVKDAKMQKVIIWIKAETKTMKFKKLILQELALIIIIKSWLLIYQVMLIVHMEEKKN
jgi:hypothetical protein